MNNEQILEIAKKAGFVEVMGTFGLPMSTDKSLNDLLIAFAHELLSGGEAVPEGMKLVPIEPTDEIKK